MAATATRTRRASAATRRVRDSATSAFAPITSLGWTIVAIGAVTWWVGARLDWEELLIVAGASMVALVVATISTVGRLGLEIDVAVEPDRVVVGDEAVGQISVVNRRKRLSLGTRVEVPVGRSVAAFEVGHLGAGDRFDEPFVVPTNRRAVIPIGPARSVKGDPLGIARREVVSGGQVLLHVHPRTIVLPSFTTGWIRDLEGQTTNDLSTSDVAFHTLREYTPGDDRRHIHWRTTARLGTMMVRQFVDTRRSHLGLVLSTDESDWADDDEFELGVSVVGSLGRTALRDDQEVTTVSGEHPIPSLTPPMMLDGLCSIEREPDGMSLRELAVRSLLFTRTVSVVAMIVGSRVDPRTIRAACEHYGRDVTVLALRCVPGAEVTRMRIDNVSLVEIGRLDDLARVLRVVGSG